MNLRRLLIPMLGLCAVTALAASQTASTVTLVSSYTSGEVLLYTFTNHATLGAAGPTAPQIQTDAEVEMHILPGATPGNFDAELHFTRYTTTVQAPDGDQKQQLINTSNATDQAAAHMTPVHVRAANGQFTTVSRSQGPDYDQPVLLLEELARTDALPSGPAKIGDTWTRQRSRPIPTMNFSVILKYDCSLTAIGNTDGQPSATVTIHSTGSADLPPGSIPGSDELAKQGVIPQVAVTFNNDTTNIYRAADAVLLEQTSSTHNLMHERLLGPSPTTPAVDTNIDSTGTVKLESIKNQ